MQSCPVQCSLVQSNPIKPILIKSVSFRLFKVVDERHYRHFLRDLQQVGRLPYHYLPEQNYVILKMQLRPIPDVHFLAMSWVTDQCHGQVIILDWYVSYITQLLNVGQIMCFYPYQLIRHSSVDMLTFNQIKHIKIDISFNFPLDCIGSLLNTELNLKYIHYITGSGNQYLSQTDAFRS